MFQVTIPLALATAYVVSGTRRMRADVPRSTLSTLFALVIIVAHASWLGYELIFEHGRLTVAHVLSLSALALALIATLSSRLPGGYAFTGLLFVFAGATTALTAINFTDAGMPTTQGWPLIAHIIFSTVAYALFGIAALVAFMLVWKEKQIRRSNVSSFAEKMPSLLTMEQVQFRAITIGFITLTLSVFSGLIFIDDIRAQHLTHKTALTALAWIVFGGLLLGRWRFGWRGRTAAGWTLTGCLLLVLAYFGTRLVLEVLLQRQWG
ncbi:MAG: inner membrane protein YpjD [Gammaproteobacteria bacterium]